MRIAVDRHDGAIGDEVADDAGAHQAGAAEDGDPHGPHLRHASVRRSSRNHESGIGVPPVLDHRLVVDDHHLRAAEGVEALTAELAAEAGGLPAAEGQRVVVDQRIVDPDHAGFEPVRRLHRLVEVGGEDRGAEAEGAVIGEADRLVEIRDPADRGDRAETLLAADRHVGRDAGEDGRLVEPADVPARRHPRAGDGGGAMGERVIDEPHDAWRAPPR